MIINEYIIQKFKSFNIQLLEADLLDICLNAKVDGGDGVREDCYDRITVAIAKFIPSLLLHPMSIGEGGTSMSWNIEGIKSYYAVLCKQYGLKDELSNKPKVTFL